MLKELIQKHIKLGLLINLLSRLTGLNNHILVVYIWIAILVGILTLLIKSDRNFMHLSVAFYYTQSVILVMSVAMYELDQILLILLNSVPIVGLVGCLYFVIQRKK